MNIDNAQPRQQQTPPGATSGMAPEPDHGEHSYKGSGRLAGKAAIITGSDSGIGRAVAIAFAREGADIVISYLQEHEDAKETQHWVENAGRRAILMPGDVSDEGYCQSVVDGAVDAFGKLDILVNNAAMQRTHESIDEISSDEWDRTFRTNVYSMFTPLGRAGQPAELAPAYVLLASDEASYMTGALLPVTGGRAML